MKFDGELNREQMQEALIFAFVEKINPYIEKGWLDSTSYKELYNFACEWIFGKTSPSFNYRGIWLSVDFECGAGCKVGSPTSTKHITVYFHSHFERFTRKQLIKSAYNQLNKEEMKCSKQLALF